MSKCYEQRIRERELGVLARINAHLCAAVAAGLGLPTPDIAAPQEVTPSPALSQLVTAPGPIDGRIVGVIVDAQADPDGIAALRDALTSRNATLWLISQVPGIIGTGSQAQMVERTFPTARSIEFDAVVVADLPQPTCPSRPTRGSPSYCRRRIATSSRSPPGEPGCR